MAEPSIDLEKLVREVLAELGVTGQSGAKAPETRDAGAAQAQAPAAADSRARAPVTSGQSDGELVVLSQVVTMSELEGRLKGVRRLVVPPQSVVTPSVRDELHRKNVTLVYDQQVPVRSQGSVRLVMVVVGSRFDPLPLTRALQSEPIEVETQRTDCLVAATDLLAGELVKPNTLGLVVSTYPAVALCLANRHRGVRAMLGIDAATAGAEAASVGANLVVVNPRATSLFQIRQIVSRFCREGPRECPQALRERLG